MKHQAASTLANKLGELNRYASVTALTIEIDAIDESLLEEYAVVYMSDIDKVNFLFLFEGVSQILIRMLQ